MITLNFSVPSSAKTLWPFFICLCKLLLFIFIFSSFLSFSLVVKTIVSPFLNFGSGFNLRVLIFFPGISNKIGISGSSFFNLLINLDTLKGQTICSSRKCSLIKSLKFCNKTKENGGHYQNKIPFNLQGFMITTTSKVVFKQKKVLRFKFLRCKNCRTNWKMWCQCITIATIGMDVRILW